MAHPEFGKGRGTTGSLKVKLQAARGNKGVWGHSPQTLTNFYGFHLKNAHFSTLFFIEKRHTVSAVVMDNAKIFSQLNLCLKAKVWIINK